VTATAAGTGGSEGYWGWRMSGLCLAGNGLVCLASRASTAAAACAWTSQSAEHNAEA
jgi:hypothetical protein